MRVAVAAMMHETNTFNEIPTRKEEFHLTDGAQVEEDTFWQGDNTVRGIIETLRDIEGIEVVPLFFARALPGGPVPLEDYLYLRRHIIDRLIEAGTVDGVCLALHGSMYTTGEPDPEGRLAFEIRAIVGRRAPIVAAFDMHAKLSPQLAGVVDGLTAYKTAPHVDSYDTGARAARLMKRVLVQKRQLTLATTRLPILIAGEKSETDVPPMQHFIDHLHKAESREGIYAADVLLGFPWADTPYAGVTISVVSDSEAEHLAWEQVRSLAKEMWNKRRRFDFTSEACLLPEALRRAGLAESKPVIISDSGDNPTAGAAQNMSYCLAKAVEEYDGTALISAIADQTAYTEAAALGADSRTTLEIGTVTHGEEEPFVWTCTIERIVSTKRCNAAIVSDGRVTCIITDRRVATYEPSLIYDCAMEPTAFDLLIVKCGYQGPEYRALSDRNIVALTPGDSNEELTHLPFQAVPRPIFPLDSGATWSV